MAHLYHMLHKARALGLVGGIMILISASSVKGAPSPLSLITPPLLKQHDTVAIVAPSWWDAQEETIIRETKRMLEEWGLQVVIGRSVGARDGQFSGNDALRLEDLQAMLDNPKIRAIFALRGGYGSARIVDSLTFDKFLKHPKWIIGFSDITTLHLRLHQLKTASIHGEMPKHFSDPAYATSIQSLKDVLFEGTAQITSHQTTMHRLGQATALVVGGNIATICSNIGTPTDLDTRGKILVLEEVGEQLYAVDRMIGQLKRAGKLQYLAGLVIGDMVAMKDPMDMPFGKTLEELVMEQVAAYEYPVAFGMPIGHAAPNLAFLHGAAGKLVVTEDLAQLSFDLPKEATKKEKEKKLTTKKKRE
jgi:muramoyltetrapeptide carboxypeptidase